MTMWRILCALAIVAVTHFALSAGDQNCNKCCKNEVFSNCTNANCHPKDCSQVGFPTSCPDIPPKDCIKGCICQQGYVRGPDGTCISMKDCPSCHGDENAVSGCGNCNKRCIDVGSTKPRICPLFCNLNGCDCRPDFVFDTSTGKCIKAECCVTCGGDGNAQPGCDKDCSRRCPGPKPCPCTCPAKGSCMCKDGFVYDPKTKSCVRPSECS